MRGLELRDMKVIYCWCKGCEYNDKHRECMRETVTVSSAGTCINKHVPKSWGGHEVKKNESKGKARTGKTT